MKTFAEHFRINKSQAELDFVDIRPDTDTPLFVDPFAISIKQDHWSLECTDRIVSYFDSLISAIRSNDSERANRLLSNLHEPNETRLGFSKGAAGGRGVGPMQSNQLLESLQRSKAARSGELKDLGDAQLFVDGFGPDKISDITTNLIRANLIEYTQDQCALHNIPVEEWAAPASWDHVAQQWVSKYVNAPKINGRPILLIPKYSVRRRMSLNSQEFYNHRMLNYLKTEYEDSGSSLVHVLKNGNRRVYKAEVAQHHPYSRDALFQFVRDHPHVLELYRQAKGAQGALDNDDFEKGFNEADFANELIQRLAMIPPGDAHAHEFESFCVGLLQFVFYPDLIVPKPQNRIHGGRKRIDMSYTNAATKGFFHRLGNSHRIPSGYIHVECKNYSHDPQNPELDQMSGRFSANRGRFGIILARTFTQKNLFLQRCNDTLSDDRGWILPLADAEITAMLTLIKNRRRGEIDLMLNQLFDGVIFR